MRRISTALFSLAIVVGLPEVRADEPRDLPVQIEGFEPLPLTESFGAIGWSEVPAAAQGAVLLMPPASHPRNGVVSFTVTRDAIIGLAASWGYDGNASGGWQAERLLKDDLKKQGWVEVGRMYLNLYDRHTLLLRACKRGEAFSIRTRKYRWPYVFVPNAVEWKKPVPPAAKAPVEVISAAAQPADKRLPAEGIPEPLVGTTVYDSGTSGTAIVRIHENGPVYVAASWQYDGNRSGQWTEEAWQKADFLAAGWKEAGELSIKHRGSLQPHTLFYRQCNRGERFRLRTRKYGAPVVFVASPRK